MRVSIADKLLLLTIEEQGYEDVVKRGNGMRFDKATAVSSWTRSHDPRQRESTSRVHRLLVGDRRLPSTFQYYRL